MQQSQSGLHPITYFASLFLFILLCYNHYFHKNQRNQRNFNQRNNQNFSHPPHFFSYIPSHSNRKSIKDRYSIRFSSHSPKRSRCRTIDIKDIQGKSFQNASPVIDLSSQSNLFPSDSRFVDYRDYKANNANFPLQRRELIEQTYNSLYEPKALVIDKRRDYPQEVKQRRSSFDSRESLYDEISPSYEYNEKRISRLMPSFNPNAFNKEVEMKMRLYPLQKQAILRNTPPRNYFSDTKNKIVEANSYAKGRRNDCFTIQEQKEHKIQKQVDFEEKAFYVSSHVNPQKSSLTYQKNKTSLDSQFSHESNHLQDQQNHTLMSLKNDEHRLSNEEARKNTRLEVEESPESKYTKQLRKRKRDEQVGTLHIQNDNSNNKAIRLKGLNSQQDNYTIKYTKDLTDSKIVYQMMKKANDYDTASEHSDNKPFEFNKVTKGNLMKTDLFNLNELRDNRRTGQEVNTEGKLNSLIESSPQRQGNKRYDTFVYSRKKCVRISRVEEDCYQFLKHSTQNEHKSKQQHHDRRGWSFVETTEESFGLEDEVNFDNRNAQDKLVLENTHIEHSQRAIKANTDLDFKRTQDLLNYEHENDATSQKDHTMLKENKISSQMGPGKLVIQQGSSENKNRIIVNQDKRGQSQRDNREKIIKDRPENSLNPPVVLGQGGKETIQGCIDVNKDKLKKQTVVQNNKLQIKQGLCKEKIYDGEIHEKQEKEHDENIKATRESWNTNDSFDQDESINNILECMSSGSKGFDREKTRLSDVIEQIRGGHT